MARAKEVGVLVVCCGMYRSGSTLQYQIASALVERSGVGRRLGWDWASADFSLVRPRAPFGVIKVHEPHPVRGVEEGLDPEWTRYVYCHRDLRDVVVSYAAKLNVDLTRPPDDKNAAWLGVIMRAYAHFAARRGRRVLVRGYDQFVHDVEAEVRVIAEFLGVPADAAACREIAADVSIERQRERMESAARATSTKIESASLVHHNHIRDGRSGQWREQLPAPWVEHVEKQYGWWLRANGYEPAAARAVAGAR
ncbi:MAG TPA: sulfotransferase domain-containing protein [Phycisphaerales bacterium]|nr:sulfotransferase domain-containing protein [Phycisphaerales bacterium]